MNIFQLNCFLAVANTLSFARAAKQMNVSQPTITNQIKMLESELNTKLFNRSTRMVELTPEGQSFMTDAKNIVLIAEQAKMRFGSPDERKIETLSIGCSTFTQLALLSDSLHELADAFPTLHPRLEVMSHEQLFHLLDNGNIDAIFDIKDTQETKGRITFKELRRSSLVCVCHKDHTLAQREYITVEDLSKGALIFCDPVYLAPDVAKLQWKLAEGRNPADIHFCGTSEASVVLAASGFGVALLPDLMVPDEKRIAMVALEEAPKMPFGIFYRSYPGDTILKKFIQIVTRLFQM